MEHPTFLSKVLGCMGRSPVVAPAPAPRRGASHSSQRAARAEDIFEPRSPGVVRAAPGTPRPTASSASNKHLQRILASTLPERGDHAWRLGNHILALRLLDRCAAETYADPAHPAHRDWLALRGRFVALLRQACQATRAAAAQVDALCPATSRGQTGDRQPAALDKVDIALPLTNFHALAQDYLRHEAQLPSERRRKLCNELRTQRALACRMVLMPELSKLRAAFGSAASSPAEQRRLKAAAAAAIERLRASVEAACRAVDLA